MGRYLSIVPPMVLPVLTQHHVTFLYSFQRILAGT
jgi:hypothetical protein